MTTPDQIRLIVEPRSFTAVGVSRRTGPGSYNLLEHLVRYGYKGHVYPVNPYTDEILGIKTYPRVSAVPEVTDLALISLPRSSVVQAVKDCIEKGIKAIIIISQGFADANDEEGRRMQDEIVALAKSSGTRILGPNTFGVANAALRFCTAYLPIPMEENGVGTISQTGATFVGLNDIRLVGKAIDVGDACDVDIVDCLEFFEQDDDTRVLALHIEGMPDAKRFLETVQRVALKKPVVALKTGRSGRSAQAVQSHTGALAGRDELWDVALREAGVVRVDDIEELADTLRAFLTLSAPGGNGIGVMTPTGGFGIIAADACSKFDMEVVEFTDGTMAGLRALSPEWLGVGNPVDYFPGVSIMGHPRDEMELAAMRLIMADERVDAVLGVMGAFGPELGDDLAAMAREMSRDFPDKPLVYFLYGPFFEQVRAKLESVGTCLGFSSPERAARALAHLLRRAAFLSRYEASRKGG
ncbi:MAG: CoA-binding protein [Dehalococcoidia bacterium]|nr:CoA-binding protein [Dehalococcoidia bacterium]